jgi:hypothetical protein
MILFRWRRTAALPGGGERRPRTSAFKDTEDPPNQADEHLLAFVQDSSGDEAVPLAGGGFPQRRRDGDPRILVDGAAGRG